MPTEVKLAADKEPDEKVEREEVIQAELESMLDMPEVQQVKLKKKKK